MIKMFYAFVPNVPNIQARYSGITDNLFRFRKYTELMTEFKVHNIMPKVEFRTYKECIDAMKFAIMNINPNITGDLDVELFGIDLISIHGKTDTENILVMPEFVYEYFQEVSFNPNEVYKLMHDLYRHCSDYVIQKIYPYIVDSPDREVIYEVIRRLRVIHNEVHEEYMTKSMEHTDISDIFYVWDECILCKRFMASEIFRYRSFPYGTSTLDLML
jgi:hypothetical protein